MKRTKQFAAIIVISLLLGITGCGNAPQTPVVLTPTETPVTTDASTVTEGATPTSVATETPVPTDISVPTTTEVPHEHKYTETSRTESTCVETGNVVYTCECGDTYTEELPLTSHTEGEKETIPATVDSEGKTVVRCRVCGEVLSEEVVEKLTPTPTATNTPAPAFENGLTDREVAALNALFGNEDGVYGYYTKSKNGEVVRVPDLMLDAVVDGYSAFVSAPYVCLYMFYMDGEEYTERYEFDMYKETGYYSSVDFLAEGGLKVKVVRGDSVKFYDTDLNEIEPIDNFHTLTYDYAKKTFKDLCNSVNGHYVYTGAGVADDGGQFFLFD